MTAERAGIWWDAVEQVKEPQAEKGEEKQNQCGNLKANDLSHMFTIQQTLTLTLRDKEQIFPK